MVGGKYSVQTAPHSAWKTVAVYTDYFEAKDEAWKRTQLDRALAIRIVQETGVGYQEIWLNARAQVKAQKRFRSFYYEREAKRCAQRRTKLPPFS